MLFGRIRRTVVVGFVAAAAAVVGFVTAAVVLSLQLQADSAQVARTREIQREVERFATSVSDIGAATRGYVVTGDADELADWRTALVHVRASFDALHALTADNAQQQRRLDELGDALRARLATSDRIVALRHDRGWDAARDEIRKGAYLIEMTRLRLLIADLQLEEERLLARRERQVVITAERLRTLLVALGVMGVASLVPMYLALDRLLREQESVSTRDAELALHDALTGLPNRRLLQDRLARALVAARRARAQAAVLFLDLDGFKAVNDRLGHDAGDLLLGAVAERLTASRRGTDTVARIAGDEFVVVLADVRDTADVERVGAGIIDAIAQPFPIGSDAVGIGTSIGWVLYPDDGRDAAELMRRADAALYAAKRAGKGRLRRWSADIADASPAAVDPARGIAPLDAATPG
ncbi:MAG: diguanylate cyclase [Burkholderiales bacterium]|nr:diguanylate cyclase [Burkholderiales bacterium]